MKPGCVILLLLLLPSVVSLATENSVVVRTWVGTGDSVSAVTYFDGIGRVVEQVGARGAKGMFCNSNVLPTDIKLSTNSYINLFNAQSYKERFASFATYKLFNTMAKLKFPFYIINSNSSNK